MTIAPPPRPDLDEDLGGLDLDALIAELYRPEGVRDRIELPASSPRALHDAVDRGVRAFTRRPGRHNRYQPVPGEHSLRTDDLLDFIRCYGHEYQIAVLRAADLRTGSRLRVADLEAEARRQGIRTVWDWTGTTDWIGLAEAPVTASAILWSEHRCVVDGRDIPAGLWRPEHEPAPALLVERTRFSDDVLRRQRTLALVAAAAWSEAAGDAEGRTGSLRHPAPPDPGLPILVVESPAADRLRPALAAAPALRAVLQWGDRLALLPHEDARPDELEAVIGEAASAHRRATASEEAA